MKIKNHVLCMMAIASLMVSCNSHPKFETSVDAVKAAEGTCSLEGRKGNVDRTAYKSHIVLVGNARFGLQRFLT